MTDRVASPMGFFSAGIDFLGSEKPLSSAEVWEDPRLGGHVLILRRDETVPVEAHYHAWPSRRSWHEPPVCKLVGLDLDTLELNAICLLEVSDD